jgi:opacity protein-like surface antigen
MKRFQTSLIAGIAAAAAMAATAKAADMPMIVKAPVVVEQFGGWYLRGDIGMTNQRTKGLDYFDFANAPGFGWLDKGAFDSGMMVGLGVGYKFNDWFRMDFTGEYRGKTGFYALDHYDAGGVQRTNEYTGVKSEWLFLGNAYVDLGTWWCVTPFVGVGIGFANIKIDHFRDTNVIASGGGWAPSGSTTNFAWALHAGLAYQATKNFTVEFAYRYLNLGDGETGTFYNLSGTTRNQVVTFNDITSHDFKLGLRWALSPVDSYAPLAASPGYTAPIYSPPPPAYSPPPPLMRKG